MITASPDSAQPRPATGNWRRQWRDAITDGRELLRLLGLEHLCERLPAADAGFSLRVPRAFVSRMRHGDAHDPLLLQVLPQLAEEASVPGFRTDAVEDMHARAAHGVLHKYHGRALLIASGTCAVNCRYCFRRHFPYGAEIAAAARWREALAYVREHDELRELILSGGDPLALATAKLEELSDGLRDTPHIHTLRLHTRLPVVLPDRVDAQLIGWIGRLHLRTVIVLHANHPDELDADVAAACERLRGAGVTLLNQSVLLRGINDNADTLTGLSQRLFDIGVLPYYLHQLDRVSGTAHFEVDDARALELERQIRERLPGYLVPKLVREIAGEAAKQPVTAHT